MTVTDAAPSTQRPGRAGRLGYPRLLAINAFWFGNGAHWQPIFVSLIPVGALLIDPAHKETLVGRVTAAGGVFALLIPIAVGWLSDRTYSRFGRRRPWMVAGAVGNVIGLILVSTAGSPMLLVGYYLVLQASNNVAGAAYAGIIPDVVPAAERGRASGLLGVMNGIGTVFGLVGVIIIFALFHDSRPALILGYAFIAVVLTITLIITCIGTPEVPRLRTAPRAPMHVSPSAASFGICFAGFVLAVLWVLLDPNPPPAAWIAAAGAAALSVATGWWVPGLRDFVRPFQQRDFFWVFATRFLVQFGIFTIVPYIDFYFRDVVGAGKDSGFESSLWLAVVVLAGIGPAIICGSISDRIHRRKRFVYVAGALQAGVVAVLILGLVSSLPVLYALGVVYGVGYGTYYSVDWALACDVLPNEGAEAGKDMALWHISFTLPQVLAPALLAAVLAYFNETGHVVAGIVTGGNLGYRVVFGSAALWFVLGTVMVRQIRGVQ